VCELGTLHLITFGGDEVAAGNDLRAALFISGRESEARSAEFLPADMGNLWPAFSIRCSAALRQELTIVYDNVLEGAWQIW